MSDKRRRGILPIYAIQQSQTAKKIGETDASARTGGINPLTTTASVGYVAAELQAVIDKLNEVLQALQAKSA